MTSSPPSQGIYTARLSPSDIPHAAELLRTGHTVAFPTETVYGLGSNALDPAAVARIFVAKQRPAWDPLIVHISDLTMLARIARITPVAERLIAAFWPGPLTLLLERTPVLPDAVTAGRSLVGVRMPAHPLALALIAAAQLPIAAPSANRFGHTSPTTAAHVLVDLDGRIDAVIDAGPTSIGLESTVLDATQSPMVLYRPGAITAAMLETTLGEPITTYAPDPGSNQPPTALPSPGTGIRHYAPRATLLLADSEAAFYTALTQSPHLPLLGIMLPAGWLLPTASPPGAISFHWGSWDDPATLAANLFAGLRTLDNAAVSHILCPLPPPIGIGIAIRDRLRKAARPK